MNKEIIPLKEGALVIYTDSKGKVELRADIEKETIWATLDQIAMLFDRDKSVISRHLKSIYSEAELDEKATVAKNATVQKEGGRRVVREIEYYSLDAIIAVGYRVNSKQATQFRIWATGILREYLVKGLVINEKRLEQLHSDSIKDIEEKVGFIQQTIRNKLLNQPEVDGILSVVNGYAHSWLFLKKYDEDELAFSKKKGVEKQRFEYDFVRRAIDELKKSLMNKEEASDLFGNERDESCKGILGNIYQTFGGQELYATLAERAAHLLYFIIKDHPFSDGNKRIGSFLFIYFLDRNGLLYRKNGENKINDNAIVALTLLIAESDPQLKEIMVKVVGNMIVE